MRLEPDIVVVGGGNAAHCATISAAESGAQVLMLEALSRRQFPPYA